MYDKCIHHYNHWSYLMIILKSLKFHFCCLFKVFSCESGNFTSTMLYWVFLTLILYYLYINIILGKINLLLCLQYSYSSMGKIGNSFSYFFKNEHILFSWSKINLLFCFWIASIACYLLKSIPVNLIKFFEIRII